MDKYSFSSCVSSLVLRAHFRAGGSFYFQLEPGAHHRLPDSKTRHTWLHRPVQTGRAEQDRLVHAAIQRTACQTSITGQFHVIVLSDGLDTGEPELLAKRTRQNQTTTHPAADLVSTP